MKNINRIGASIAGALTMTIFAVMASMTLVPIQADAQSQSRDALIKDLREQIEALQVQIRALEDTSVSEQTYSFTRDLSLGDRGSEVRELQQFLNGLDGIQVAFSGPGAPGQETTYFGPRTKQAVEQFQFRYRDQVLAPVGLTRPTGFWGPSSRDTADDLARDIAAEEPDTEPDEPQQADEEQREEGFLSDDGEASITNFNVTNRFSHEDLDEGSGQHSVMEFEFDVEHANAIGSRLDVNFEPSGAAPASGEDEPWQYMDTVFLIHDGETIATRDVSEEEMWDKRDDNGNGIEDYQIRLSRFSVKMPKDTTQAFTVAVTPKSSIDNSDLERAFDVFVPEDGFRARDGVGIDHEVGRSNERVAFTLQSSEGDLDLSASPNDPQESILRVEENSDSPAYEVFTFEAEGEDADIIIEELTMHASTTHSQTAHDIADVVKEAELRVANDQYDDRHFSGEVISDSTGTTSEGRFFFEEDELDDEIHVAEDNETEITLMLEFYEQEGNYPNNLNLISRVRGNDVVAESVGGDRSQVSGDVESEQHTLLVTGVSTDFAGSSVTVTKAVNDAATERGHYRLRFDVTAFEESAFIPARATTAAGADRSEFGIIYDVEGDPFGGEMRSNVNWSGNSSDETANGHFRIDDGEQERITLSVVLDNEGGQDGFYGIRLEELRFANEDSTNPNDFSVISANLGNYQTEEEFLAR